jgi:diacylglycerol kinase (ATP)
VGEFKKLLFIINKHAGTGYQPQFEGKIIDACIRNDVECTILFTSGRGHATQLATNGAGRYDVIVATGGDGTVNEVATGLVSTGTPMGIIPTGSGNGLARHLRIPLRLEPALQTLLTGRVIDIDSFRINGKLSVNVSGIGFDGHIANLFGQTDKRGFWGYARLVLKEYFNYGEFEWVLHQDGHSSIHRSFILAIANSSQYGNNAVIAPGASVTDQRLNLSEVRKLPLYRGPAFVYGMFKGKLRNNNRFNSMVVNSMRINTSLPVAYHVDGEPCGSADQFEIEVFPSAIRMIVPMESQG